MSGILRQNTAVDILIGPFVDLTDGFTAETGETPSVKLSKNGQALTTKNDVTTPVHDAGGYYNCELDATDTNTVGTLRITVPQTASARAMPPMDFQIIGAVVYDAIYGATPTLITALDIGQLHESTIGTVTNQTTFINDTAIVTDDNWIGQVAVLEDVSTGDTFVTWVTDVVQATDTIVINAAPSWTVAVGDKIRIESRQHPTYALNTYDPPTRTELSSDTSSILAKLLAYVRIMTRKDAAIATDDATEVTAINADVGSGAGAYNNVTDSLEATQDKVALIPTTPMRGTDGANTVAPNTVAPDNAGIADIKARLPTALDNGAIKANVDRVNNVKVTGTGATGDEWGP